MLTTIFSLIGAILIIHAGYSANHFKHLLISMNLHEKSTNIPIDIIIESLVGFAIILIGQIYQLKLIPALHSPDRLSKTIDEAFNRSEYSTYTNRQRFIYKRIHS
mmetsp:Transcript_23481/g.21352  ORF Transcript_23481/g.21352 Transcript_23481/m.21352 type:complete len:105 (-) Transcript_23481:50-364(-)